MTQGPAVSVVMSVYNASTQVMEAVESVRRQSFKDWEFLIIDDGSTDGTLDVLRQAARLEPRIRLVRNPHRSGLASALNTGWRIARSDLIARMDADDICLGHRLAVQVEYMRCHPEIDVLGTAVEVLDHAGRVVGLAHRPERHEELVAKLFKENPFIHPTVIIRRRLLEELGGYDESLRRAQDFDLWLRAHRRFRFHNLRDVALQYRARRRPPTSAILWGTWALARGAAREGRLLSYTWYALRFLAAGTVARIGARGTGAR